MIAPVRAAIVATALIFVLGAVGCRPTAVDAPYAQGEGPAPEELLAQARPQLPAIQVAQAKVVANRSLRGNLAFLAQAPDRFRGTVGIAGNELVTLAFTEEGYALRYKLDAFPTGFYHGPPSSCAVGALLGVALDESDLVALVLGGAPVIDAPHEIVEQGWDRAGYEKLVIANDRFVQSLQFRPIEGQWRFVGGALWERGSDGGKGKRLWSLAHDDLARHGDYVLPARTRITAPGKRKDELVAIVYKERELDPAFARAAPVSGDDDGGKADDGGDDGQPSGDEWGGDDGWEGEGDGWESNDPPADAAPGTGAQPPTNAKPATPSGNSATAPSGSSTDGAGSKPADNGSMPAGAGSKPASNDSKPARPVPVVFRLQSTGLPDRGDLCR